MCVGFPKCFQISLRRSVSTLSATVRQVPTQHNRMGLRIIKNEFGSRVTSPSMCFFVACIYRWVCCYLIQVFVFTVNTKAYLSMEHKIEFTIFIWLRGDSQFKRSLGYTKLTSDTINSIFFLKMFEILA